MAKKILTKNSQSQAGGEFNAGNSGSSKTIDWNNGASQKLTLTANCALTLTGPLVLGSGYDTQKGGAKYTLKLIMGSGGPYAITFTQAQVTTGFSGPVLLSGLATGQWAIIEFLYDSDSECSVIYHSGYGP